ncbi:MAG: hypothetical protein E7Z86_08750 [Methanosphaera stadtmanae]|nr:hypothetical protein [Methanosphaera stadtmanae]
MLNKQGLKKSQRITKINTKFKQIQNNYLNHITKFIIDLCKKQDIGTIILGYNKDFQNQSNMRPPQNQIFAYMAFKQFKEKLENKCKNTRHNANNSRRIIYQ